MPVVVGSGVALMIDSETRPMNVELDSERLHIDGGFYEIESPDRTHPERRAS